MVVELFVNSTAILNDKTLINEAPSYLSFIITNKIIIGQKYWGAGMTNKIRAQDVEAKQILKKVFPDRKVVMLDPFLVVNLGGGGLHCISMHLPELEMN